EELLAHQRLERRRVVAAAPLGQRDGVGRQRDERLARPGRRRADDVRARRDLEQRALLVRVELEPAAGGPRGDRLDRGLRATAADVGEAHRAAGWRRRAIRAGPGPVGATAARTRAGWSVILVSP